MLNNPEHNYAVFLISTYGRSSVHHVGIFFRVNIRRSSRKLFQSIEFIYELINNLVELGDKDGIEED